MTKHKPLKPWSFWRRWESHTVTVFLWWNYFKILSNNTPPSRTILQIIQDSNDSITQMKSIESLVSLSAKVDFECKVSPKTVLKHLIRLSTVFFFYPLKYWELWRGGNSGSTSIVVFECSPQTIFCSLCLVSDFKHSVLTRSRPTRGGGLVISEQVLETNRFFLCSCKQNI